MSTNVASILDSTKKFLGFESEYEAYDPDITMFINASLGPLMQIGVGPTTGFVIEDKTTLWSDLTDRTDLLSMVKLFIYMSVRLGFDPPQNSFGLDAIKSQLEQLIWRINVQVETPLVSSVNLSHWWLLTSGGDFPTDAVVGDFGFDPSTGNIYVNGTQSADPEWWDLTGLSDFPDEAIVGEFGFDSSTGQVWRKTA